MMETDSRRVIASYKLNEAPLFPPDIKKSAEHRLPDGTVLTCVVENGMLQGYTARDAKNKAILVTRMLLADEEMLSGQIRCYYCICNPVCNCWPEPCPVA
jgi:hypothetical protein